MIAEELYQSPSLKVRLDDTSSFVSALRRECCLRILVRKGSFWVQNMHNAIVPVTLHMASAKRLEFDSYPCMRGRGRFNVQGENMWR